MSTNCYRLEKIIKYVDGFDGLVQIPLILVKANLAEDESWMIYF
jgi:hypothetical protein